MNKFGTQLCTSPIIKVIYVRGGADKFLARPGRKQATTTKLRIHSTHSPRSSINLSGHYSNFWKPPKKFRIMSIPRRLWGSNGLHVGWKMVVVRRDQIRRIGCVIQTFAIQVGQFLLRCKCLVRRCTVVQEQDSLVDILVAFFLQNVFHLQQQKWVILRVDSLVLWEITNEEDTVLIPENRGENFSSGFLHWEYIWAGRAAMLPLHWLLHCVWVIAI